MNRENLSLGIASLVIAFLLWYQVQPLFEPGRERELAVKLKLINRPEGMMAIPSVETVLVIASGTRDQLDRLEMDSVEAVVDLRGAEPGDRIYPVEVSAPNGSNLNFSARTPSVRVSVERLIQKARRVNVVTTGIPPAGLEYNGATTFPETVLLVGPRSYLDMVDRVQVTFDLPRLKPGLTHQLDVQILDKEGRAVPLVNSQPGQVTVNPAVAASAVERQVLVKAVLQGEPASGYSLRDYVVTPQTMVLTGKSEAVGKLTEVVLTPVSIQGLRSTKEFRVKPVLPEGVVAEPSEVLVRVEIGKRSG
ncbi:CdaR family protein [Kamptonema cortianum]|nr:CdaR family protein [Kamptonema cortianum]